MTSKLNFEFFFESLSGERTFRRGFQSQVDVRVRHAEFLVEESEPPRAGLCLEGKVPVEVSLARFESSSGLAEWRVLEDHVEESRSPLTRGRLGPHRQTARFRSENGLAEPARVAAFFAEAGVESQGLVEAAFADDSRGLVCPFSSLGGAEVSVLAFFELERLFQLGGNLDGGFRLFAKIERGRREFAFGGTFRLRLGAVDSKERLFFVSSRSKFANGLFLK